MSAGQRVVVALAVLAGIFVMAPTASAQADPEQELVDRYAPIIMIKAQEDGECDSSGEQYAPTSVEVVLDNDQIVLRQLGTDNPVMQAGPSASDLFPLGEGFYLDFPGDALDPGCLYEQDFRQYSGDRRPVVYGHVARQADAPDQLAIQYWFYWYYNDWNNLHESDWEGIQVLFDVGSVEEALATEPVSTGYAQHEGGERADWDSTKLTKQGTRPVVYSSRGSHASYYASALYLGRRGTEGFGCDNTDGPSTMLDPDVVLLPDSVESADDPLAWLNFEGHWGERQSGAFNGPTGPITKDRWTDPVTWHDGLRKSSAVVPGGDDAGASIVDTFCTVVGLGSKQLVTLKQQPALMAIVVVLLFLLIRSFVRRTDWTLLKPLPIVERRRAGQLLRGGVRLYRAHPRKFAEVGLVYIPIAIAIGVILALLERIPLLGTLLSSEEDLGLIGLLLALTVSTLGHIIGFYFVRATVAVLMDALGRGEDIGAREAYRRAFSHLGDLFFALLRTVLIVGVLLVSIVGIPWGIRQLVRYQFLPETITLEGTQGQEALDRSSELIRGRWFNTAIVLLSLNGLVLLFTSIVALLVLIIFAGIPLWLFSIIVTAFAALVVPYTAISATLLYGDARAELEDDEPADRELATV
jgi:hypothetical protein